MSSIAQVYTGLGKDAPGPTFMEKLDIVPGLLSTGNASYSPCFYQQANGMIQWALYCGRPLQVPSVASLVMTPTINMSHMALCDM
jgi:hypothetical protein